MPNRISKHQVLSRLNCHVRRDVGKSERVEGQESLHTAASPTGYLCSATSGSHYFCFELQILPYCKMACLMKSPFPTFCHDVY